MGLAISYHFQLENASIQEAKEKILALHQYALTLPFQHVSDLVELVESDCLFQENDPFLRLKTCALTFEDLAHNLMHNTDRTRCRYLMGFSTQPGEGCAEAVFGLATHKIDETDQQWLWNAFCKTLYANNPDYGGIENFLRCHVSIIKMLDLAQQLGIVSQVVDPSGYWENRDVEALIQGVTDETAMMAAVMGSLKDIFAAKGYHGRVPIQDSPNFEYLEAEGLEKLRFSEDN